MDAATGDVDELIEFWILLDEDRALLAGALLPSRQPAGG
jgi:hypothetical protein